MAESGQPAALPYTGSMLRILAAALALAFALPSFAVDLPSEREKWIEIETGDLHIFSNASERQTSEIAQNLVRMREAVGRITQLKVHSAVPTNVYIFRNESSFAPYRDLTLGRRAGVSGLFLGGDQANFILLDADAPGGIDRVVYHELTHYFVKNTLAGLPLWFHEGIAEYYSTFSARGEDVDLGIPIKEHVLWLRDQPLIPLAELFAVDTASKDYNEGSRQGVFYAESWAMVHYLLNSPERHAQLPKFLTLLASNQSAGEAFLAAFNSSFDDMEKELKAYVRRLSFQYRRYAVADLAIPPVAAPKTMAHAEVLYRLGDLLTRGSNGRASAEAERFLRTAIYEQNDSAGAYATLALLHDLGGRIAEASVEYERAVKFGSNDPGVYLSYGLTVFRAANEAAQRGNAPASEVHRARGLLERAAQLAPGSARAWAAVGATYVISDDAPAPGIAALEKSLALAPGQEDAAVNLVQLYARADRIDDASRILNDVVARTGNRETIRQCRESILFCRLRRAESLIKQEKMDDAVPILRTVLNETTDAELRARITTVLADYESHRGAERQAVEINHAIELANRGKFGEALAIIDALLPQITDPELLASTKSMRTEMAKAAQAAKK